MTVALTHENMSKMTAYRKAKIAEQQAAWMQRAAAAAASGKKPMGRPPKSRASVLGLEEPTYQKEKKSKKPVLKDGEKPKMGRPRKYPNGYKAHMKEQRKLAKQAKDDNTQDEADSILRELKEAHDWQSDWLSTANVSDAALEGVSDFDTAALEKEM